MGIGCPNIENIIKIPLKHVRILQVKVQQQMPIVVNISRKNSIFQNAVRLININHPVFVKKCLVLIIM